MASRFLKRWQQNTEEKSNPVTTSEQPLQPPGINPLSLDQDGGFPVLPMLGQKSPAVNIGDEEAKDNLATPSAGSNDDDEWPDDQYVYQGSD